MPDTWLSNTQGNIHVSYEPVIGRGKAYIQIALNYFICKKIICKTISTLYFFSFYISILLEPSLFEIANFSLILWKPINYRYSQHH